MISSWSQFIETQTEEEYFEELDAFLRDEAKEHTIYPKKEDIFKAFELTPIEEVKVCVIGQDVYHTPGCAMGLAFSVPPECKIPPSLRNIFQEIKDDLNLGKDYKFSNGDLSSWAKQGVLLLNSILTVRRGEAGSHAESGWQNFTNAAIELLNESNTGIVFLLLGAYAQKKAALITNPKHLIIRAAHPSPFSAHNGFFGSKVFSKTNEYLESRGQKAIDWKI